MQKVAFFTLLAEGYEVVAVWTNANELLMTLESQPQMLAWLTINKYKVVVFRPTKYQTIEKRNCTFLLLLSANVMKPKSTISLY